MNEIWPQRLSQTGGSMQVPSLELLVECDRKPRLRVVSLPTGRVRPARLVCPKGIAADEVLPVRGWVGVHYNDGLWGAPRPPDGEPRFLLRTFRAIAARDDAGIWVGDPTTPDRTSLIDFNGRVVDTLALVPGQSIEHVNGDAYATFDMVAGELFVRRRTGSCVSLGKAMMMAGIGKKMLVRRSPDAPLFVEVDGQRQLNPARREFLYSIVDLHGLRDTAIATPRGLVCTASTRCLSPNGDRVVFVGCPRDEEDQSATLVLVDLTLGETLIVTPAGDPTGIPVWSADSRWVLSPEMKKGIRVTDAATGETSVVPTLKGEIFQLTMDLAGAADLA